MPRKFHTWRNWVCVGLFAGSSWAHAGLALHRTQVRASLTPRPVEAPRSEDVFFDQRALLEVKVSSPFESSSNLRFQWIFLYDDVTGAGRAKRQQVSGICPFDLSKGEERSLRSREIRLTGKINKKGLLMGMRYEGYGVRLYEGDRLIYEACQPAHLKREIAEMVPIPAATPTAEGNALVVVEKGRASRSEPQDDRVEPLPLKTSEALSSEKEKDGVTESEVVYGISFAPQEAEAVLEAVNEWTAEDLATWAGVGRLAAKHLVERRPFSSLAELSQVSYVKKKAIASLKNWAGGQGRTNAERGARNAE